MVARYGFAIDLSRCIGCHACSLACKAEHQIPVGVHRCWVKSVEQGVFPDTARLFFPVLCNQCDHAPCVAICPTGALFTRPEGIIDVDGEACIGCRACMQACPYDQLFIDPNTRTAEKCNFCANRLETGLLPTCVSVCPTECRVFGDLNDEGGALARLVRTRSVKVRKPEKATGPKIFYIGADDHVIRPELAAHPVIYKEGQVRDRPLAARVESSAEPGAPRVDYDIPHAKPWGAAVFVYLLTKGLSAGVMLLSAALWWLGYRDVMTRLWAPLFAATTAVVTAGVLVADLQQPGRFLSIVTRPNWRSWLARGTIVLVAHGALAAAWAAAAWSGADELVSWLSIPAAIAAMAAAAYTGPLFAQGAGRDLWQGWRPTAGLLLHALIDGAAVFLVAIVAFRIPGADAFAAIVLRVLLMALLAHTILLLVDVAPRSHASLHRRLAVTAIRSGPFANRCWWSVVGAGVLIAIVAVTAAFASEVSRVVLAGASILAVVSTSVWHDVWVDAGQAVPLS